MRSGRVAPIIVTLELSMRDPVVPSPVRPGITYPAEVVSRNSSQYCVASNANRGMKELASSSLNIGVRLSENSLYWMRGFEDPANPRLMVDVRRRALFVFFKVFVHNNQRAPSSSPEVEYDFRLKIDFLQLTRIFEQHDSTSKPVSLLTILDNPPIYHRRLGDVKSTFTDEMSWREADTWYRQTSVVHNPWLQNDIATNIRRSGQIIDIGKQCAAIFLLHPLTSNFHQDGGTPSKSHSPRIPTAMVNWNF